MKPHNIPSYRSGFESKFKCYLDSNDIQSEYEQHKLTYNIPASNHTYTPDFKIADNVFIETKGLFDATDRKKHLLIQSQHPNIRIIIVFQNWNTKINKKSKTSYKMWCDKNLIECYNKVLPESILNQFKGVL